ncbi:MAG: CFI-box-CTERM domain-containing protein [Candidatus Bathyarchaeia archaeon]
MQSETGGVQAALGAVGGGDITMSYDSSIPIEARSYTQTLFDIVYPEIRRIYGEPSNRIKVTLRYDPRYYPWNFYDGATNTITMSQLPPSSGTSPTWDAIFTHELIHSFHDAIYLTGGSWAEEGMTEAATEIVAMNLAGTRDLVFRDHVVNLKYYDVWSYMGRNVLGGGPDFTYKVNPDLSYRISAAMFFILTSELSSDPSNPYDFLAHLNSVIYADASANPFFDDLRFKLKIRQAASGRLVEGQLADVWVGNQPVTASFAPSTFQIGVYPYRPENPSRVWAITFTRQPDQKEVPIGGQQVAVRVVDSTGSTVQSGLLTTSSDGMGFLELSSTPLPTGGYQIVASTIFNGVNYTAKNYAYSQGESILIERADINLYGVTLSGTGRPVPSSVTASGGTVKLNTGGAFKIEASSQTPPLELTVTSGTYEKKIGKPNPYTRVAWTNSTAPAPTPYRVTVNINGLPSTYSTTLRVDGATQGVIQGGGSVELTFEAGTTHNLGVDGYINASSSNRYHCIDNMQTVTSQGALTFEYLEEFLSAFQQSGSAKPLSATIDGSIYALPVSFWWVSGSNHTFTFQSNITEDSTRYLLTGSSLPSPVLVTGPITITGFYKTQYYLEVSAIPAGLVTFNWTGWHDEGSRVDLEAPDVQGYTFKRWIVDGSPVAGNPIQVEIDSAHKAIAEYESLGVYDVTVTALYVPRNEHVQAEFTWDGQSFTTPQTFRGLTGSHSLVIFSVDSQGHPFAKWQDIDSNITARVISAGGTYTALFGTLTRNFTVTVSPEHQRIGPGMSTTFTVNVEAPNGFSSPVTLGVKGLPAYSNSTFEPRTLTPPGSSTLKVTTSSTTPVGSYILTITAAGDGQVRVVLVRLSMGACIVATATYGSELSPEVQFLRSFRDGTVRRTFAGDSFMTVFNTWYYSFSPLVADFIGSHDLAKGAVKVGLYPLIGILHVASAAYVPFKDAVEVGVFLSGAVASILIGAVYLMPALTPLMFRRKRLVMLTLKAAAVILASGLVFSLLGEYCSHRELMMIGTSMFVVGTMLTSTLAFFKLAAIVSLRMGSRLSLGGLTRPLTRIECDPWKDLLEE